MILPFIVRPWDPASLWPLAMQSGALPSELTRLAIYTVLSVHSFCSMKSLEVLLLSVGWNMVISYLYPFIWVERGTVLYKGTTQWLRSGHSPILLNSESIALKTSFVMTANLAATFYFKFTDLWMSCVTWVNMIGSFQVWSVRSSGTIGM